MGSTINSTANKIYYRASGTTDTNWSTGVELSPVGALLNTGAAIVNKVYGGSASYGFMVRSSANTSLFEIQGSDGKVYF